MTEPEVFSRLSPEPSVESLQAAYKSLSRLINVILLALIILTGSLFVFFLREVSVARRQVRELVQFVGEYERTGLPVAREFTARLQAFAQTNADFRPILAKYMNTNATASASAPVQPSRQPQTPMPPQQ